MFTEQRTQEILIAALSLFLIEATSNEQHDDADYAYGLMCVLDPTYELIEENSDLSETFRA